MSQIRSREKVENQKVIGEFGQRRDRHRAAGKTRSISARFGAQKAFRTYGNMYLVPRILPLRIQPGRILWMNGHTRTNTNRHGNAREGNATAQCNAHEALSIRGSEKCIYHQTPKRVESLKRSVALCWM